MCNIFVLEYSMGKSYQLLPPLTLSLRVSSMVSLDLTILPISCHLIPLPPPPPTAQHTNTFPQSLLHGIPRPYYSTHFMSFNSPPPPPPPTAQHTNTFPQSLLHGIPRPYYSTHFMSFNPPPPPPYCPAH